MGISPSDPRIFADSAGRYRLSLGRALAGSALPQTANCLAGEISDRAVRRPEQHTINDDAQQNLARNAQHVILNRHVYDGKIHDDGDDAELQ